MGASDFDWTTQAYLDGLAAARVAPVAQWGVGDVRDFLRAKAKANGPGPEMHEVIDELVDVGLDRGEPTLRVRALIPISRPRAVMVYLHGGGWVAGSMADADTIGRKLAERTGCAVVLVEYRIAPEHRFPAPRRDTARALEWATTSLRTRLGEQVPLVVAGEGVGATLAALAARDARDGNGPQLALQVLVQPLVDASSSPSSSLAGESRLDHVCTPADLSRWAASAHVDAPDSARLDAGDLAGLPPACVVAAELDGTTAAVDSFVQKLRAAGVQVDYQVHAGQIRGFFSNLAVYGSELGFQQVVRSVRRTVSQLEHQARMGRPGA